MTNSDSKSIVAIYLDKLHSIIPTTGSQKLVFRGLENKDWGLESTAYLRYAYPLTHSDFIQYNCELIASAKNANYHIKENNELEEIELLAELRHYGAATALIDFTRDFLVALWFASRPHKKNEIETDGKIVIVNRGDSEVFLELTSEDKQSSLEEILKFKTREDKDTPEMPRFDIDTSTSAISDQKKAKLWYWQPRFAINHRLSAQKGVFIFGKVVINTADIKSWEVIISQKDKEAINRELSDRFGIDEDSLFNDLPGFAMVNDKTHENQTRTASDYFQDAVQHRQRGEFEQAIKYIDKAIELDPDETVHLSFRGLINRNLKRYEDALRDITRAIELEPDKAIHHYLRGQVNRNLKRYEDALSDFTKAIELEPDKAFYYTSRGLVNRDLEKHEDALRDITRAIELEPDKAVSHYSRGQVNRDLKRYEDALRDINKAIELEPDKAVSHYSRGQVNHDLKRYEDALRDINKAIELEPDKAVSHYSRGQVNHDLKRYEDALRDITRAIELEPDYAFYYTSRGLVNRDLEKHEDALSDFTKAIELDPDEAVHHY